MAHNRARFHLKAQPWRPTGDCGSLMEPRCKSSILPKRRLGSLPPPVQIQDVVGEHKTYNAGARYSPPRETRDLQIDYTALSFRNPPKVSFRYKLDGRDKRLEKCRHASPSLLHGSSTRSIPVSSNCVQ